MEITQIITLCLSGLSILIGTIAFLKKRKEANAEEKKYIEEEMLNNLQNGLIELIAYFKNQGLALTTKKLVKITKNAKKEIEIHGSKNEKKETRQENIQQNSENN